MRNDRTYIPTASFMSKLVRVWYGIAIPASASQDRSAFTLKILLRVEHYLEVGVAFVVAIYIFCKGNSGPCCKHE